ncbi:MAG: glutamine-hydrolyzing carbamoyl-phosphate synthase small subunit [Gemmataceae bacterium]
MPERVAKLALEDGTVYTGRAFGASGERYGEVVFNTSMTGYQETLTDPSYKGQIVTMTYPLIGNYGVNSADTESSKPQVEGFIVRELSRLPSNFRSEGTLDNYLAENGVIGLEGIDTRALVRRIRVQGAMTGILSTTDVDDASLVKKAGASPSIVGRDLVREVVPSQPFEWKGGFDSPFTTYMPLRPPSHHVVALDFGMKRHILRCLTQVGCRVTVLPGTVKAEEVLAHKPDGIFLSNGPGDPEPLGYAISTIRHLASVSKPIFGICLGHQLLGLALGGTTFKLKFGHRGVNQPVLNTRTGKVEITTQNHGFAVRSDDLPSDLEATHINLNDRTIEGLRHRRYPIFSVQYHPEASAGPHDSSYLFEEFRRMME